MLNRGFPTFITRFLQVALLIGVLTGIGCSNREKTTSYSNNFNPDWAQNKFWDDGLAEVATYAAERIIYNKVRTFDYTLITVKEDFNKAYNVKTDDYSRRDLFPVMKVNQFCRIPTENYPYHFMTSLFFKRDNPVLLHKLTNSSQEWCGTTFKAIDYANRVFNYQYNSYWDKQGTGKMRLAGNILFEDQLPYTLRSLKFKEGLNFKADVAELIQTSKATQPDIYEAAFIVNQEKNDSSPATWKVSVAMAPGKINYYWFDQKYPNTLIRQQTWDGRNLALREIKRSAYWKH